MEPRQSITEDPRTVAVFGRSGIGGALALMSSAAHVRAHYTNGQRNRCRRAHKQIGQRASHHQAVGVLRQSAITHRDEAEHRLMTPMGCSTPAFARAGSWHGPLTWYGFSPARSRP